MDSALSFISGALVFAAAAQKKPLDHLAPVAIGLGFLGPTDCGSPRDNSWQATSARALTRQQTEAHLPVYERGFIASPGASV